MIKTNRLQDGTLYYEYSAGNKKRMTGVVSTSEFRLKQLIGVLYKLWLY